MDAFAEIAIVDYRLSFVDLVKQASDFRFRLQQTKGSLPIPFSICCFPLVMFLFAVGCPQK
jgi:hypothetical protein